MTDRKAYMKDYLASYGPRRYQARKEAGLCVLCGLPNDRQVATCSQCFQKKQEYDRQRYQRGLKAHQKLKQEVFRAYGGACCVCCGEQYMEFLTLDHVNGGGNQHRESLTGSKTGGHFYRKLKELGFPNDPPLQVMCLNCNWAKGHYEVCPHEFDDSRGHTCCR